jgi:hypothetical protein
LGKLELRVVVHDGVAAAVNRRVGCRVPNAIDLDSTLYGTNTKGNFVFGLYTHGSDWLCLEHLRRLRLLALVDLAVLAQLVTVVPQLQKTEKNCTKL